MSALTPMTSSPNEAASEVAADHTFASPVADAVPAAIQVPDRLRWWRQHRLRELPIPEGHYILNRDFFNYTSFGTRPLSQHLLKDLRNARQALAHHYHSELLLAAAAVTTTAAAAATTVADHTDAHLSIPAESHAGRPTSALGVETPTQSSSSPAAPLAAPRNDDWSAGDDGSVVAHFLSVSDGEDVEDNKRYAMTPPFVAAPPLLRASTPPFLTNAQPTASRAREEEQVRTDHEEDSEDDRTDSHDHHNHENDEEAGLDSAGDTARGRASRPPTRALTESERVALTRFVQLFRVRAASAPVRPTYHRDCAHSRRLGRRSLDPAPPLPSAPHGAVSETCARVLVLHNPPRVVLHTKRTTSDTILQAAHVSRADREQNTRLLDHPEVLDLSLFPLLPHESDFYTSQLHSTPIQDLSGSGGRGRRQHRRRAASQPVLPLLWSTDLLAAHGKDGRRRRARGDGVWMSPTTATATASPTTMTATRTPAGLYPEDASSHLCRRLADLQDVYIFNPLVDGVGEGAFSQVYAAVPFTPRTTPQTASTTSDTPGAFPRVAAPVGLDRRSGGGGGGSHVPVVALKIIARKGKLRDEQRQRAHTVAATGASTMSALTTAAAPPPPPPSSSLQPPRRGPGENTEEDIDHDKKPRDEGSLVRDSSQRRELVEVEREISVLRQLKHTGCSQFYEALRTPDAFVIAMKLNKGCMDARQFLARFGPPSEARSALLVYQLVETIHYLHNVFGVLHRDIKLENVLVSLIEAVPMERVNEVLGPHIYKDEALDKPPRHATSVAPSAVPPPVPATAAGSAVATRVNHPHTCTCTLASVSGPLGGASGAAILSAAGPVRRDTHNDDNDDTNDNNDNNDKGMARSIAPPGSPTTPAVARLPSTAFEIEGARSLGLTTIDTAALLLQATLIDFGLARRIHTATSHRPATAAGTASHATVNSPSPAAGAGPGLARRGMPTPLPSTANMLTGFWEVEEESGASSTDVSASQTEEDEDEVEAAKLVMSHHGDPSVVRAASLSHAHSLSTTTTAPPLAPCAQAAASCSTPLSAHLPPRCPSSTTNLSNKATTAATASSAPRRAHYSTTHTADAAHMKGGRASSNPSVHRTASLPQLSASDAPASAPSMEAVGAASGLGPGLAARLPFLASASSAGSLRSSAATTPMAVRTAAAGASASPSTQAPPPSQPAAQPLTSVADDSATILLTPCGTEKYLAPEMVEWIQQHGWARRPTSVGLAKQMDMYAVGVMTYVFLSGSFPFNASTRATLAQQQKRVPRCSSERWRGVSSTAISFVQGLLEPDPERRLTAEAALSHPFLHEAAHVASKLGLVPGPIAAANRGGVNAEGGSRCEERPRRAYTSTATTPAFGQPSAASFTSAGSGLAGGTSMPPATIGASAPAHESLMDVDALVDQLLRDSTESTPLRASGSHSASLTSADAAPPSSHAPPLALPSSAEPPAAGDEAARTSPRSPPRMSEPSPSAATAAMENPSTTVKTVTTTVVAGAVAAPDILRGKPPGGAADGDDGDLFDELYNNIMFSE